MLKKTIIIAAFVCSVFSLIQAQNDNSIKFESFWEGKLNIQSFTVQITLKIFRNGDGSRGALLDIPDLNGINMKVGSLIITSDSLKFEVPMLLSSYSGQLDKSALSANGVFKRSLKSFPLELIKVDRPTELKRMRPQTPAKPFSYNEEEITFENKTTNISLTGTFTYPKEGTDFPAVVLVSGSGPQDRDETFFDHKPFLVIADFLTRKGFAVLRYDDRGFGKSKGIFKGATSKDFAEDALSAVEYLKSRKETNKNKIGIMGHSEGGLIATMCAARSKSVSFIVLLAGTGVPGKDLLVRQDQLLGKSEGKSEREINITTEIDKLLYEIMASDIDSANAVNKAKEVIEKYTASLSEEEKKSPELEKNAMAVNIEQSAGPWFRFFLRYDPRIDLEKLKIPVLALNGEKDIQVDPKQNLPEIKKSLDKAENKKHKIVELQGLNHLFQSVKIGTTSEYKDLDETFSVKALEIINEWLQKI